MDPAGSDYGPINVPLGNGLLFSFDSSGNSARVSYNMSDMSGTVQDFGPVSAPILTTVFDPPAPGCPCPASI